MSKDPVVTNPELYRVILENDRVRVLEYLDRPGDRTQPHEHPDTVMITLTGFRRRLSEAGREVDVELPSHQARWVSAQEHSGQNTGDTPTHSIFVELKEASSLPASGALGPSQA
jgi:beta-alanine degradation protein BauB